MTLILETATRDAMADAIDDQVNSGSAPELVFETSGDAEVAACVLNATNAFGASSSGTITLADVTITSDAATAGTVAQFSIYTDGSQSGKVLEGSVTVPAGGGDIELSTLAVATSETIDLTAFTITVPAS